MKSLKYAIVFCSIFTLTVFSSCKSQTATKPVRGTWLNLVWQDERNNYMNPPGSDCTDPALWRLKVKELREMGMEYLVIMAVANEEKSYYPSGFMPPAYPADRESPVEAIMNAADECGMKVFMSSGWARNQLDNLRNPEIKAIQQRIMEETAARFGGHESFYGWYLPVEDSFDPVLSDYAVEAVNALTRRARELTPGKRVMISPYGLCNAAIDDPVFAGQIYRLEVDIIAYQDEVGCVREPMPMKRMKEHFAQLGRIHSKTDIELWANVESFTWDRATNSWFSSLVPAAFGRYLSQMTGVSDAGVDEVISFSIYGIYDKPGSPIPLGQPVVANRVYAEYMEWTRGEGRWPLLEATFRGNVSNGAKAKKVTAASGDDLPALADGKLGVEDYTDSPWARFGDGKMEVVIDLGSKKHIGELAARFLNYRVATAAIPEKIDFYISADGIDYRLAGTASIDKHPNDLHDCWIDMAHLSGLDSRGRYVKITAENGDGSAIMCDEIFINPVVR